MSTGNAPVRQSRTAVTKSARRWFWTLALPMCGVEVLLRIVGVFG